MAHGSTIPATASSGPCLPHPEASVLYKPSIEPLFNLDGRETGPTSLGLQIKEGQ